MPLIIKNETLEQVKQSKKPVVVDVHAPWCGPCQQMAPLFEELEKELGDTYLFASLNVEDAREIAISYGVSSIPTFLFIKDGQLKGKVTGYMSKEDLKEQILLHLG